MVENDYDLSTALQFNPQSGYTFEDITEILAVWEGKNNRDDWRWIVHLKDKRYVFIQGGCGYTGWNCQSYVKSFFADGPLTAMTMGGEDESEYIDNAAEVYLSLQKQLNEGKNQTWREAKNAEFDNPPFVDNQGG